MYISEVSMRGELVVTVAEARAGWAELVARVAYEGVRVVLTKHGRRVAALVQLPVRARRRIGSRKAQVRGKA